MKRALTLANTPLDLQITICIFLNPSDILALRNTCKALEPATRKRIVWMAALHRVCLDNALFLPSFSIPDMSDLELERAAMAPHKWLELCNAFQKQNSNASISMLYPRTTRIIEHGDSSQFFIVPGGRYMVTAGEGLYVWDLGYVSTVDCKLVASVGLENEFQFLVVQATPDGKGLVILTSYNHDRLSIFEIYPQSEIPVLTQIAHFDWSVDEEKPVHLLPDTLICCVFPEDEEDGIVFRVVDYRTNYSTFFSADVDLTKIRVRGSGEIDVETFATKTAIILLGQDEIFIWAIPSLSPQQSDLRHFLDNNSTHIPPLLKIPFPDNIARHRLGWSTVSSWYLGSGSLESIYFDFFYSSSSKFQRLKLNIKPDLSDTSLQLVNISEFILDNPITSLGLTSIGQYRVSEYRICEDALVYFRNNLSRRTREEYTALILTSAPFTNVLTVWDGYVESLCPTSGRIVYCPYDRKSPLSNSRIVVVDIF